jgi:hypothetical protein
LKLEGEAKAENGKSLGAWSAEDLKLEIWNLRARDDKIET